jgi:FKBP-type peptidyl-prolyl cis-trans isomerase 2
MVKQEAEVEVKTEEGYGNEQQRLQTKIPPKHPNAFYFQTKKCFS